MFSCEIRDPIHRTVGLTAEEVSFVDHPFVQRLRHIKQLGLVSLVYPGATHDRLGHSLGALHLAGLAWSALLERDGAVLAEFADAAEIARLTRLLRLAALMHDLGHPPLSHVAEAFLAPFSEIDFPSAWRKGAAPDRRTRHEDMSVVLIAALAEGEGALLSPDDAQDIASLVHKDVVPSPDWRRRHGDDDVGLHALLKSLVSGELDCDRMDYLLRDAYVCGTVYGNYDVDRLVRGQGLAVAGGRLVRYVDANAVRSFEDFLLARYHMFLQVYWHKTAVGFDICLAEAVRRGEVQLAWPGQAAAYAESRDAAVTEQLFAAAKSGEWARRLVRREPLKLVLAAETARSGDTEILERLRATLAAEGVESFEASSRQFLSRMPVLPGSGALYARRKIFGQPTLEPIARYSDLLQKYNEQIDLTHVYVRREDWPRLAPRLAPLAPSS